jgi:Zn finger protein HypA/HybF involved in hydrogenase expression
MGDVADMMIDGTLCEGCGVVLDGEAPGHPRYCRHCDNQRGPSIAPGKVKCPECGKHVKASGLNDHQRDRHTLRT